MKHLLLALLMLLNAGCLSLPVGPDELEQNQEENFEVDTSSIDLNAYGRVFISVDGGAMFGVIPLVLFQDLEDTASRNTRDKPQPLYKYVDGFYGISTGAIISALLTLPIDNGVPATATKALDFYRTKGKGDEKTKAGIFQDDYLKEIAEKTHAPQAKQKLRQNFQNASNDTFKDSAGQPLPLSSVITRYDGTEKIALGMFSYRRIASGIADPNVDSMYIFGGGAFGTNQVKIGHTLANGDALDKANGVLPLNVLASDAVQAAAAVLDIFGEKAVPFPLLGGATQTRYFVDLQDPGSVALAPDGTQVPALHDPTFIVAQILKIKYPNEPVTVVSFGTGYKAQDPRTRALTLADTPGLKVIRIDPKAKVIDDLIADLHRAADVLSGKTTAPKDDELRTVAASAPIRGSFNGFDRLRLIGQNMTRSEDPDYRLYAERILPLFVALAKHRNP